MSKNSPSLTPLNVVTVVALILEIWFTNDMNNLNGIVPAFAGIVVAPVFLYFFITRFKHMPRNIISLFYLTPILFILVLSVVSKVKDNSQAAQFCREAFQSGRQAVRYDSATHTTRIVTNIDQCNE